MSLIYPTLLAGGSGTRLWPLSRKSFPKQFSDLIGNKSLFQKSALRLTSTKQIKFAPHLTITNSNFRFIVHEQLQEIGIKTGHILIEPESKNTAPAILAASLYIQEIDPDAILLVAPSDHIIPDVNEFHEAIKIGLDHVNTGKIVTFGISPTHPNVGYGYIELAQEKTHNGHVFDVLKFIEKPTRQTAEQMIKTGKYFWNAGIFLFKAVDMIKAFEFHSPNTLSITKKSLKTGTNDLDFFRLNPEYWSTLENISIDYAIMEKAKNLVAVPYFYKWSDLGSWNAVWSETKKDLQGVATSKNAHAFNCVNTLLRSESANQQIIGLGLKDIVAIAMPDAVLVTKKDDNQNLKEIVDHLNKKNIDQAETFPKDHRPWGWFESLALGERFQVKRICVKPGAALSLQSHNYRSEHWIVVEGIAKVTIENKVQEIREGHSIYVPLKAKHRLENIGKKLMVLIEVQIGSSLSEDDIVRYEDLYNR